MEIAGEILGREPFNRAQREKWNDLLGTVLGLKSREGGKKRGGESPWTNTKSGRKPMKPWWRKEQNSGRNDSLRSVSEKGKMEGRGE